MTRRAHLVSALALGLAPLAILTPTAGHAQVSLSVSVRVGPPPLPVYVQPPMPGPNFIWTPGYWAWDDWWQDYYWVPGTWVRAPRPGLLWTPGWWGWSDGFYLWHAGYWGPHVGWYGGIDYGFGYTPTGFFGGYWHGGNFFYNRSVTNVQNTSITNVYNQTVINKTTVNNYHNVAFSGGPGGVQLQPSAEQRAAMQEPHVAVTADQEQHAKAAQANRTAFASVNRGRPAQLAVARPQVPHPGQMIPHGVPPMHGPAPKQDQSVPAHPASAGLGGPAPAEHKLPAVHYGYSGTSHAPDMARWAQPATPTAAVQSGWTAHVPPPASGYPQAMRHPQALPRPEAMPHPQARPAQHAPAASHRHGG